MRTPFQLLPRAMFGALVVAALGFGAAQAFASTGASGGPNPARYCDDYDCDRDCRRAGYDYGNCHWQGHCICYLQA